jgi:hypothetical protein
MNKLPQELIYRIVRFTERYPDQDKCDPNIGPCYKIAKPPSQFPRLAGLNRRWKEAVEKITFHHLTIKSHELDTFHSIVVSDRRKYLAKISFTVLLPEYSHEARARVESQDEQRLNDEAFTKGIYDLFVILKGWEDDGVHSALHLNFNAAASPTDYRKDGPKWEELMYEIAIGRHKDILSRRWEESRLQILKPSTLPVLFNIQHLKIDGNGTRRFAPRVAPDLAISLPNLKNVDWEFPYCGADFSNKSLCSIDDDSFESDSDSEHDNNKAISPQVGSIYRMAFADALRKVRFQPRSSALVDFYTEFPMEQRRTCPSIVPSGFTYDPFSATLRTFSQNLTALKLRAHLDSTLFWPSPAEQGESAVIPNWPYLKTLDVTFDMVTPSGNWYFRGSQPSHPDDNFYWNYRLHPDRDTFDPFLAACAKAINKMPVLEYFILTSELQGPPCKFHISYHAPGNKAEWGDECPEDLAYRRIYYACEVGKVWFPEPETAEGLRGAGSGKFGGEVIERFIGSQYY